MIVTTALPPAHETVTRPVREAGTSAGGLTAIVNVNTPPAAPEGGPVIHATSDAAVQPQLPVVRLIVRPIESPAPAAFAAVGDTV